MSYYSNNDGCFYILALPLILGWHIAKFVIAICACALVVPVRIAWLFVTIPIRIFTGEDHTADWEDSAFIGEVWSIFFPSK